MTPEDEAQQVFRFFTEVGIINQLISTLLEQHLPGRMTATQFGILGHLSRRPGGETPLQLSNAFQVPKTSMTHMLSGLEGLGLITLTPNARDKRSKIARATAEGQQFLGRTTHSLTAEIGPLVQTLGLTSFTGPLPDLTRIREALDKARD